MRRLLPAILCALALASCSSSSKPSATPDTGTPTTLAPGDTIPSTTDVPQTHDPCKLLTAAEMSTLAGGTVKRTASTGGIGALACVWGGNTAAGGAVSVKVDKDAATAHSEFPTWVQPLPGKATGLVLTQLHGLGDEASETRQGKINAGIYVRKGALLLKIGVYPAAPEARLRAAITTALGRA